MSDVTVVYGLCHLNYFPCDSVWGRRNGDVTYRADFDLLPPLLANVDHRSIQRHTHTLVWNNRAAWWVPLLWQGCGSLSLCLRNRPKLGAYLLAASPDTRP